LVQLQGTNTENKYREQIQRTNTENRCREQLQKTDAESICREWNKTQNKNKPVGNLRHTLKGAVLVLKVNVGGPVVRKILRIAASSTASKLANVGGRHGRVKGISSHNLMHVRRRHRARVDQGIKTVNDELAASEPQHGESALALIIGMGRCQRREGEQSSKKHLGVSKKLSVVA
jgi:hypothetical protein